MEKLPIKRVVDGLLKLKETGESGTLLGIGPMSSNLLRASFELGRDLDVPLMYIASRNQVDADVLGGGYVNGWDQQRFARDIQAIADEWALRACTTCAATTADRGSAITSAWPTCRRTRPWSLRVAPMLPISKPASTC